MEARMLKEGDQAPEFTLKSHEGRDLSLSAFRGRRVVLWFYPKADTPGCTKEGCAFRDRAPHFEDRQIQILGVSFDTVEENRAFAEKYGFNYPLLCDVNREVGLAYGACAQASDEYPQRIAYVIGPEGTVERVYPRVEAASFPETVLADLSR